MSLRAPHPKFPVYEDAEHTIEGHWEPTRWWRVSKDGRTVAESSEPEDYPMQQAAAAGGTLERRWVFVPAVHQYREETRDG